MDIQRMLVSIPGIIIGYIMDILYYWVFTNIALFVFYMFPMSSGYNILPIGAMVNKIILFIL